MNLKEIREMINLMNENDLTEIEIEREGTKIKLKKSTYENPYDGNFVQHGYRPSLEAQGAVKQQEQVSTEVTITNRNGIKSPMVGTFYRAPSPDSPPFVEVGQIIEIGQPVCIVEAMKLMNEIKSEIRGKVIEIPIENAQPVEFGQTLFVLEPL